MDTQPAQPLLFTPMRLRGVTLPNRLVLPPMAQYSAEEGVANEFHLAHYGRFAVGGAGLIFIEATGVTREEIPPIPDEIATLMDREVSVAGKLLE